jgi:hypothetical protein
MNIKKFIHTLLDFINFIMYPKFNNSNINNTINNFLQLFNTIFNSQNILYNLNNKEVNKISLSEGKLIITNSKNLYNNITYSYTNTVGIIEYVIINYINNYYYKMTEKVENNNLSSVEINELYNILLDKNNKNIYKNYNIDGIK